MPPRRRGRPRINPLPQDRHRNRSENIDEQAEAQASITGSSFITATQVATLARVIPTLTVLAKKDS